MASPVQLGTAAQDASPETLDSFSSFSSCSCFLSFGDLPLGSLQSGPVQVELSPPSEPSALVCLLLTLVVVEVEQEPSPLQLVVVVVVVVVVSFEPSSFIFSSTSVLTSFSVNLG